MPAVEAGRRAGGAAATRRTEFAAARQPASRIGSEVEEHRLAGPLEADVEAVDEGQRSQPRAVEDRH